MSLENTPAARISALAAAQKTYFRSGATLSEAFRRTMLRRLDAALANWEKRLCDALWTDLHKSPKEAYLTEISIVRGEIRSHLRHLGKWMRPERRPSPLKLLPSKSRILSQPLGQALIVAPWNYPVQLLLNPLVGAISAGCTALLKPSPYTPNVAEVLERMIAEIFDEEYVAVAQGGREVNTLLFGMRWDVIFFTGSPALGRIVMTAAARNLTPVVLELGGKSPCIVHSDADVRRAAQRIAWGKGINTGQTCVAPDYFLVHESVADSLVEQLDACFHRYYGENILAGDEWPRMINRHHFDRVMGLIQNRNPQATVAFGGQGDADALKIEPTCLRGVTLDDPVMNEEIFGPVLPVITYQTLDEAFAIVRHFEKPLATYIFSNSAEVQQRVIHELPFGGATINDVVVHLANNHMGFGGVGNSGMGAYHGKVGFDCFTHYKSTLKKGTWLELPVRNPPFGDKIKLLRMLMR